MVKIGSGIMEDRLKVLLWNAITLLVDETFEQYDDVEEWKEMLFNELGTTEDELKHYGVDLEF
jgi:hypothetical protein